MGGTKLAVKVTLDGEKIDAVEILSHSETPGVSDRAIRLMPERIVEANSFEVDAVTGGTVTSNAIKAAVADALSK